mmetsp:Transcript_75795/g.218863  ORF Transcript_75795/g.218863 Transcript_75795/m.218863 type:complete len:241 (-) Transcript_75795:317-1039(-)
MSSAKSFLDDVHDASKRANSPQTSSSASLTAAFASRTALSAMHAAMAELDEEQGWLGSAGSAEQPAPGCAPRFGVVPSRASAFALKSCSKRCFNWAATVAEASAGTCSPDAVLRSRAVASAEPQTMIHKASMSARNSSTAPLEACCRTSTVPASARRIPSDSALRKRFTSACNSAAAACAAVAAAAAHHAALMMSPLAMTAPMSPIVAPPMPGLMPMPMPPMMPGFGISPANRHAGAYPA